MIRLATPEHERLARDGMYRPEFDACGFGLVAATDGRASRRIVRAIRDGRDVAEHRHGYPQTRASYKRKAA